MVSCYRILYDCLLGEGDAITRGTFLVLPAWQKGMSAGEQMFWQAGRDRRLEGCGEGDNGTGR